MTHLSFMHDLSSAQAIRIDSSHIDEAFFWSNPDEGSAFQ